MSDVCIYRKLMCVSDVCIYRKLMCVSNYLSPDLSMYQSISICVCVCVCVCIHMHARISLAHKRVFFVMLAACSMQAARVRSTQQVARTQHALATLTRRL